MVNLTSLILVSGKRAWLATFALVLTLFLPAAARAGLADVIGHYEGAWTNLTFGSTGKAVIDIQVTGASAALVFDMDGFVFGFVDPPVINMPGTVQGEVIQISNQGVGVFGDISGSVDATFGTLTATITNVPGGFISRVTATGTVTSQEILLNYTVDFPGPSGPTNPALGVMKTAKAQPFKITRIEVQGANLVLEWAGGTPPFTVQTRADAATGTWQPAGPATSNRTITLSIPAAGVAYFRVAGQ